MRYNQKILIVLFYQVTEDVLLTEQPVFVGSMLRSFSNGPTEVVMFTIGRALINIAISLS